MIQVYTGDMLITGITDKNLELLKAGHPLNLELTRPARQWVLVYGPTKREILKQLESVGYQIPIKLREQVEADPL